MYPKYEEVKCETAEELWDALSPQKFRKRQIGDFIYRGQGNAVWQLMPAVLRREQCDNFKAVFMGEAILGEAQVYMELRLLEHFAEHCDVVGLHIINDSRNFRAKHLNSQKADTYYTKPSIWPSDEVLDIMALAQHHGIPTRLLDWSKRSFVAAYFAASDALSDRANWQSDSKLAVWILNLESMAHYEGVKIVRVPGSTTANMAAQAGLFTLVRQFCDRGKAFAATPMEDEFGKLPNTPLQKITLPVSESNRLIALCEDYGVTASILFPNFDGAARSVMDSMRCWQKTS